MKITPADFDHIKTEISKFSREQILTHKQFIINEGKAKDVNKRLRWDVARAADLIPFFTNNLYKYCNDEHIDTALKRVLDTILD